MGKAAEIAQKRLAADSENIGKLRDLLENELLQISGTRINGNLENRLYNVTNVLFEGCDSDALIMGLENIAVSNGSACTSASIEPSHVLMSLGMTETEAFSCIRFSLGRFNNAQEIPQIVEAVKSVIGKLRTMRK